MTWPLILGYHAVSEDWDWRFAVTPAQLEGHVTRLLRAGYRPATVTAALREPAAKTLAVTFDDGFRSVAELAEPILTGLGVPATVFVVTDYARLATPLNWPPLDEWEGTSAEGELASLSWQDLRSLAGRGWEIGSHTCSHAVLPELGDEAVHEELHRSRQAVQAGVGEPCAVLAYPFGAYDDRVAAAARAAGYSSALTFPPNFPRSSRFAVPRIGMVRDAGELRFRLEASAAARSLRSSRAAPLLRRAARLARRR